MAQWVNRKRADGGTSVQIKWRQDGRWASETFTDVRLAGEFRTAVENAGHQWPHGWVKGTGWAVTPTAAQPQPHPEVTRGAEPVTTFADVATSYFSEQDKRIKRGRVKPYTVHRSRRTYALHLSVLDEMPFTEITPEVIEEWIDVQLDIPAAPKSIRNRHGLLFSIMKHGAARMAFRADNPCEVTELPVDDKQAKRNVAFYQHG